MILDAVTCDASQSLFMGGSTKVGFGDNSVSFLEHFQDATEKISSENKIRWDHLDEEEQKCEYFASAENGIISYEGAVFVCDYERNELQLGDCSDRSKCLTIPLSKGGSLVVNRDNIDELKDAISMFSPEDQLLIMKAIMIDKRAQQILNEIEEESFAIGSQSYTIKEWDKMIERFDKIENEIKEQIQEEIEKQKEEQEKKELIEDDEDLILGILS